MAETPQPYVEQPCQKPIVGAGRCWRPKGHDGGCSEVTAAAPRVEPPQFSDLAKTAMCSEVTDGTLCRACRVAGIGCMRLWFLAGAQAQPDAESACCEHSSAAKSDGHAKEALSSSALRAELETLRAIIEKALTFHQTTHIHAVLREALLARTDPTDRPA